MDIVLARRLTLTSFSPQGMIQNLIAKGPLTKPLLIHNRTPARSEALVAKLGSTKLSISSSVEDLVSKSDIILTCLGDDPAVLDNYQRATSQVDVKGKLFIDCSTVHPKTTNSLDELVRSKGARFIASPVFGAPAAADAGHLVFVLASNDASAIDTFLPYIKGIMGRSVIRLDGKPPGTATLLKLSGNHFILAMVLVISESLVLASKSGLGKDAILAFLQEFFPGPYVKYAERMIAGDYIREEPLFQVDLALKDARHAMNLAKEQGIQLGVLEEAERQLLTVKKECGEKGDLAGIYGAKRVQSGLPYKEEQLD